MSSKTLRVATLVAMTATLVLGTGCKNFKWPWSKKSGSGDSTAISPIGPGSALDSTGGAASRPPVESESDLVRGQYAPVYFEYDSAKVRPAEYSKLQTVAEAMKQNTSANLLVEGHCDERGTAEYNRVLGERRAQSVREGLMALGVSGNRISTVSYGKDRPAEFGHNDTAWSRNRRAEFVVIRQ